MQQLQGLKSDDIKYKIYGVSWNKGASPVLTRTDASVGMVANAGVDSTPVVNDFDSAQIYKDITEVTDDLGNVFVRIPKFYIEKTDGVGYKTWRISRKQFSASCYVPACFGSDGYAYIGKYNASLNGTKLESKPDFAPLISKTIVDFRTYARNNGAGYQQLDIHAVDMLQVLFTVEFATLDSQSIMQGWTAGRYAAGDTAQVAENGVNRIIVLNAVAANFVIGQAVSIGTSLGGTQICYGRMVNSIATYDGTRKSIIFDGPTVNIAVGNIVWSSGWISGFSDSIVASSGSPVSNSDAKHPCMYRGIENPWGSVWEFVDGVNINERQAWICRTPADYASNLFASPYEPLAYVNGNTNGYPTAMGYDPLLPFAEFPTAVGGNAATYYADYYYQNTGQRIALFGALWNSGSSAGARGWRLYDTSGYAIIYVGGRLLKKAL